jgi:hypothetical protein
MCTVPATSNAPGVQVRHWRFYQFATVDILIG